MRPLRVLTREELMASVRQELVRLLNTRLDPARMDPSRTRTVLEYGVADYTAFHPANQENRRRLAYMIETSIATFEPRLRNVRVHVDAPSRPHALAARIEATLVAGSVHEPISFPMVIRHRDALIEVHADE